MISVAWYDRLPNGLQSAVCSLAGWGLVLGRRSRNQAAVARGVMERLNLANVDLGAFRDARLREFVAHAARTVPYYQRLFAALKLDPDAVTCLEDMQELPVLTPETVAKSPLDFVSRVASSADFGRLAGQGTSSAWSLPLSRAAAWERDAIRARFHHEHGIVGGTWCAYFGGTNVVPIAQSRAPYWRVDWPGRRVLFSPYHLSEQTVEAFVDALNDFQCPWIHGSPAVLSTLAGLMAAARLSADYPVEWVTTDEALPLGVQQRAMRRVFGISSKRSYIDPHAVASITEHADGALVIDEDYAAVELIAGDEDGTYRVIGTNLSNAAAPLLRYDTGSVVRLAKAVPVAGAPRHVATWEGPLQNLITLPSGARIGRLERMFDDLPQVIAAQIFQHADLIIDVDVRMAPGSTKAEAGAVSDRVAARFGAATCRVNYTDRLAPVTGGKLRAVHSEAGGVNRTVVEPRARLVCIQ